MTKLYTKLISCSILTAAALPAAAQQLPNAGFENDWVKCYPWTSNKNSNGPFTGDTDQGMTPSPWCISNTIGTGRAGKTTVGSNVDGHLSSSAIKLINIDSKIGGNIIPGYVSLGTTWSTSTVVSLTKPLNKDGGTFGGISFTNKPDALSLWYTRAESSDNSTIIAYLWKGTYTQQDVPGNITFSMSATPSQPKLWTMIDRDRNILDIATEKGGDITSKGTLIASINAPISTVATEWTEFFHEFEYKNNDAPEKINVIISAGDYFNSTVVANSSITVDDVKLIYYSRLKSLKVGEKNVTLEDGKYDYTINGEMPATEDAFVCEPLGKSATAAVAIDPVNKKATVTVSNVDNDKDGKKQHVYNLSFLATPTGIGSIDADNANAPVEYFNMQGMRVENPENGLYIRRQGNTVTKVLVK